MKLINKIIKIPIKLINIFIKKFLIFLDYKFRFFTVHPDTQNKLFNLVNLYRQEARDDLEKVLKHNLNMTYSEDNNMFSEHLILFSALSKKKRIKNILEIGTFDGQTTLILKFLFEKAKITTIDLRDDDACFTGTYNRGKNIKNFVHKRNKLLDKISNINFRQVNSLELVNWDEKFDLIWVDGAHGYPFIAVDIINAYRLSNSGGIVLIDDVWINAKSNDKFYKSNGAYETLLEFKNSKLISDFILFNKRLSGKYNIPGSKKFIGYFEKI